MVLKKNTVVIVDDEVHVIDFLANIIASLGQEVVGTFNSPDLALEKIAKLKPDYVFTDITMPKMNGNELIKKMPLQLNPWVI